MFPTELMLMHACGGFSCEDSTLRPSCLLQRRSLLPMLFLEPAALNCACLAWPLWVLQERSHFATVVTFIHLAGQGTMGEENER